MFRTSVGPSLDAARRAGLALGLASKNPRIIPVLGFEGATRVPLPLPLPPLLLPLLLLPFAAVPRVALMFNAASCSALVDRSGGSSAARAKATRR